MHTPAYVALISTQICPIFILMKVYCMCAHNIWCHKNGLCRRTSPRPPQNYKGGVGQKSGGWVLSKIPPPPDFPRFPPFSPRFPPVSPPFSPGFPRFPPFSPVFPYYREPNADWVREPWTPASRSSTFGIDPSRIRGAISNNLAAMHGGNGGTPSKCIWVDSYRMSYTQFLCKHGIPEFYIPARHNTKSSTRVAEGKR